MKSPKPPDPYKSAAAQSGAESAAATQSSIMNNPNTYTPYGSQTYSIAGYEMVPDATGKLRPTPRYNQVQTLSPDQQRLHAYQTGTQSNMGQSALNLSAQAQGAMGKPMDTSSWQAWNQGPGMENLRQDRGPTDRKAIEDAMMASYQRGADPRNQAQGAQLAARGMAPGSQQDYSTMQRQGDEFGEATRQAYLQSGNESRQAQDAFNRVAGQRFDMGGAMADRSNALRGLQGQEAFALRNQPLNELNALLTSSAVTAPQFGAYQGQGISAPNLMGGIQNQYAQQSNSTNAFNSGLFGLGATVLGGVMGGPAGAAAGGALGKGLAGSDRRLKQDIEPIGEKLAGVPLYSFRYKADPEVRYIGVMADEVRPLHPDAVIEIGGFDHVYYDTLHARHEGE